MENAVLRGLSLPTWARLLIMFVSNQFCLMVYQGIRYIADCRNQPEEE